MTRLHAARAGETPEVFSLDAQTARDTTRKNEGPNDDRLTTDPGRQRIRGTSQDFEQLSNGDVKIEMNRLPKDGGPENADAWASTGEGGRQDEMRRLGGSVSQFRQSATALHSGMSSANYCLPRPALCGARFVGSRRTSCWLGAAI